MIMTRKKAIDMTYYFGSARHDENGRYSGGKAGDQTGTEVAIQEYYDYTSKGGWIGYRFISAGYAEQFAKAMKQFCKDNRIGYSQSDRYALFLDIKKNKKITKNDNTDCSELIRALILYVTGKDVGDFTTLNEGEVLMKSGLFKKVGKVTKRSKLYNGDILVTAKKGHTGAITQGYLRKESSPASTSGSETDRIAKEVIQGKWGSGDARRVKLAAAGYSYKKVQARVNRLLKK